MVDFNFYAGGGKAPSKTFGKLNISPELASKLKELKAQKNTQKLLAALNNGTPTGLRASKEALGKLSNEERQTYDDLFNYTNSKSHGLDPVKDAQIKEWNEAHPDCKIRSQYDNQHVLKVVNEDFTKILDNNLRAPDSALKKLSQAEQEQYEDLFNYTNSKSHGMNPEKDAQIKEWNETHPDCQIKSQYDTKGIAFNG